jgi:hypothetical protein
MVTTTVVWLLASIVDCAFDELYRCRGLMI